MTSSSHRPKSWLFKGKQRRSKHYVGCATPFVYQIEGMGKTDLKPTAAKKLGIKAFGMRSGKYKTAMGLPTLRPLPRHVTPSETQPLSSLDSCPRCFLCSSRE